MGLARSPCVKMARQLSLKSLRSVDFSLVDQMSTCALVARLSSTSTLR